MYLLNLLVLVQVMALLVQQSAQGENREALGPALWHCPVGLNPPYLTGVQLDEENIVPDAWTPVQSESRLREGRHASSALGYPDQYLLWDLEDRWVPGGLGQGLGHPRCPEGRPRPLK